MLFSALYQVQIMVQVEKRKLDASEDGKHPCGQPEDEDESDSRHSNMLMMKILGPLITFVDRPWKV